MGKRGQGVDDDRDKEERVANGSNDNKNKKEVDLDHSQNEEGRSSRAAGGRRPTTRRVTITRYGNTTIKQRSFE